MSHDNADLNNLFPLIVFFFEAESRESASYACPLGASGRPPTSAV